MYKCQICGRESKNIIKVEKNNEIFSICETHPYPKDIKVKEK